MERNIKRQKKGSLFFLILTTAENDEKQQRLSLSLSLSSLSFHSLPLSSSLPLDDPDKGLLGQVHGPAQGRGLVDCLLVLGLGHRVCDDAGTGLQKDAPLAARAVDALAVLVAALPVAVRCRRVGARGVPVASVSRSRRDHLWWCGKGEGTKSKKEKKKRVSFFFFLFFFSFFL